MASCLSETLSFVGKSLAGCSCPGLDSNMQADCEFLKNQGVVAVISLNDAEMDFTDAMRESALAHLRVKVQDYKEPTLLQLQQIRKFWEEHKEEGIICVHCNAGMGRTGTVLACLLMCEDDSISAEEAIAQLRKLRKGSVQTYKQEDGVKAWGEFLASER